MLLMRRVLAQESGPSSSVSMYNRASRTKVSPGTVLTNEVAVILGKRALRLTAQVDSE